MLNHLEIGTRLLFSVVVTMILLKYVLTDFLSSILRVAGAGKPIFSTH